MWCDLGFFLVVIKLRRTSALHPATRRWRHRRMCQTSSRLTFSKSVEPAELTSNLCHTSILRNALINRLYSAQRAHGCLPGIRLPVIAPQRLRPVWGVHALVRPSRRRRRRLYLVGDDVRYQHIRSRSRRCDDPRLLVGAPSCQRPALDRSPVQRHRAHAQHGACEPLRPRGQRRRARAGARQAPPRRSPPGRSEPT